MKTSARLIIVSVFCVVFSLSASAQQKGDNDFYEEYQAYIAQRIDVIYDSLYRQMKEELATSNCSGLVEKLVRLVDETGGDSDLILGHNRAFIKDGLHLYNVNGKPPVSFTITPENRQQVKIDRTKYDLHECDRRRHHMSTYVSIMEEAEVRKRVGDKIKNNFSNLQGLESELYSHNKVKMDTRILQLMGFFLKKEGNLNCEMYCEHHCGEEAWGGRRYSYDISFDKKWSDQFAPYKYQEKQAVATPVNRTVEDWEKKTVIDSISIPQKSATGVYGMIWVHLNVEESETYHSIDDEQQVFTVRVRMDDSYTIEDKLLVYPEGSVVKVIWNSLYTKEKVPFVIDIYKNGTLLREEKLDLVFEYKNEPYRKILEENIEMAYPINGMRNFYKRENSWHEGVIGLKASNSYWFSQKFKGKEFKVRFTAQSGDVFYEDLDLGLMKKEIRFPMPPEKFRNGEVYKMELVAIDYENLPEQYRSKPLFDMSKKQSFKSDRYQQSAASDFVVYTAYFRVSHYDTFREKVALLANAKRKRNKNTSINIAKILKEPFDAIEVKGRHRLVGFDLELSKQQEKELRKWYGVFRAIKGISPSLFEDRIGYTSSFLEYVTEQAVEVSLEGIASQAITERDFLRKYKKRGIRFQQSLYLNVDATVDKYTDLMKKEVDFYVRTMDEESKSFLLKMLKQENPALSGGLIDIIDAINKDVHIAPKIAPIDGYILLKGKYRITNENYSSSGWPFRLYE